VTSQSGPTADNADNSIRSSMSLGVQTECAETPAYVPSFSTQSWLVVNREESKHDYSHRKEAAEQLVEIPVCNLQYSGRGQTGAGSDSNRDFSEEMLFKDTLAIGGRIHINPTAREDDSFAVEVAEGPVEAVTHLLRDSEDSQTETGSGFSVEFTQAILIEEISESERYDPPNFRRGQSDSLTIVDSEDRRDSRFVTRRLNQPLILSTTANDLLGITNDELQAMQSAVTDTPIFVVRKRAKDLWDT
jgi:hypothetical protein